MNSQVRYFLVSTAVLLSCFLLSSTATATLIEIDQFAITKNTSLIFDDQFDDGNPPPSAPNFIVSGRDASYYIHPTDLTVGTESDGVYAFDTTQGGIITSSITGNSIKWQSYRVRTNIAQGQTRGLRSDDDLIIQGLFNFALPDPKEAYGIRLVDYGTHDTNGPNDAVFLELRQRNSGDFQIRFRQADFENDVVTTLEHYIFSDIDLSIFDQILFELSTDGFTDEASDNVYASFTLFDNEDLENPFTIDFTATGEIFNGEDFTRAEFFARAAVPVPSSILLMAAGLIGLTGLRRKAA